MGLLCKRRACKAGEYNTATIQRQRHSCHGPSEEVRVVSCALFAFRTIFSEDSYLDWLGQTAFTAVRSLTEYLCAGDSILDGRLYMFSSQGCNRDRMWELGENSSTRRNIKVHGDSVRIFIMCRPQGFGKK